MTRFTPSRNYLGAALVALAFSGFSGWFALEWPPSWIPACLFALTGFALLALACWPAIEVTDQSLFLGSREVPWTTIRRIDHTGLVAPLLVRLTLAGGRRLWLLYPGNQDAAQTLLHFLCRFAEDALVDGEENPLNRSETAGSAHKLPSPKYPILRAEDEEEVERLYHRLRKVGHLDTKSNDEN
jgi:hypothetical protein